MDTAVDSFDASVKASWERVKAFFASIGDEIKKFFEFWTDIFNR